MSCFVSIYKCFFFFKISESGNQGIHPKLLFSWPKIYDVVFLFHRFFWKQVGDGMCPGAVETLPNSSITSTYKLNVSCNMFS